MRHHVLKHIDGDFSIVLPPPVLDKNLQLHSKLVRIHHLELLGAIERRKAKIWPPEDFASTLYSEFKIYFQKVAALLDPPIDSDILDPIDRHLFFVCGEPYEQDGLLIPDLSGLEKLMGFRRTEPGTKQQEPEFTTGDIEFDLLVDTLLIFKKNGFQVAKTFGVEDLAKVCKQAGDRMTQAQRQAEQDNPIEETEQTWKDDEEFLAQKAEIESSLAAIGVDFPNKPIQ